MDKNEVSGLSTGFIMGVLVGATIGFLFAPLPGKETREVVREGAKKVRARTAEMADDMREVVTETYEDVKGVTAEAIEKSHTHTKES